MMNNKFVDVVRPGLLSNTFGEDSIIWVKLQQLFFFCHGQSSDFAALQRPRSL